MQLWAHVWHEFWWKMEQCANALWHRVCPDDRASCWLDFLPAFCCAHRYKAQNQLNALKEAKAQKENSTQ